MAVSFSSRKCDSCGGNLEYIRSKKVWQCRYCGQEIVREEKYDGLFTIKNVARQVIVDAAYRRLDQAAKNLTECEKIDSRYLGTVIARICYRLIAVITPGACGNDDIRGMYQRLKDDYNYLKNYDSGMSEDEEALYEFLSSADSASDAFSTLILVFDTLGDTLRPEYLFRLLDVEKVYSKECNKDLLAYSLKNRDVQTANAIISNRNNIDLHSALDVVLTKSPDGPEKAEMAVKLLTAGAYTSQDRDKIQEYIKGQDSYKTKAGVLKACKDTGATPGMDDMIQYVLAGAQPEDIKTTLEGVCTGHMHDNDLYTLFEYALKEEISKAGIILDAILDSKQFAVVNSKFITMIFMNYTRSAEDRIALWSKVQNFKVDPKGMALVVNDYLCGTGDTAENRSKLLDVMFRDIKAVSAVCLDRYLLNCKADGENKPVILQKLFALEDMRPAYFNESLGKYIRSKPDEEPVASMVIDVLIGAGLALDPASINDFICSAGTAASEKVEMLRRLENNQCHLRADALSVYLEKCSANYEEALFAFLFDRATVVSEKAIRNFVLDCAANSLTKAQNAAALASKQAVPFGASMCQVMHLSHKISCSLAQAYLLTTKDCYDTSSALLRTMASNTKIAADIQVDGTSTRMKKYVKDNKAALTPLVLQLCEEQKMFSLF